MYIEIKSSIYKYIYIYKFIKIITCCNSHVTITEPFANGLRWRHKCWGFRFFSLRLLPHKRNLIVTRNHIINAPAPGAWLSFVEHHMWSSAWSPVEKGKCVSEWTMQTCIWSPKVNTLTSPHFWPAEEMVAKLLYIQIQGYNISSFYYA